MQPNVRSTWAPRGETPVINCRTRHHEKVSAIGALVTTADGSDPELYFRLYPAQSVDRFVVRDFLAELRTSVDGPLLIVWDRLSAHRSPVVCDYVASHQMRLLFLPPYAPELNPIEQVWGWTKNNPLANLPLFDVGEIASHARRALRSCQRVPRRLAAFLRHCGLFKSTTALSI